eukprot:5745682-Pyramimonas_sp.AAC.1
MQQGAQVEYRLKPLSVSERPQHFGGSRDVVASSMGPKKKADLRAIRFLKLPLKSCCAVAARGNRHGRFVILEIVRERVSGHAAVGDINDLPTCLDDCVAIRRRWQEQPVAREGNAHERTTRTTLRPQGNCLAARHVAIMQE